MFEQVFKNIDDVLRKEAGCTTELDYTEQTSSLLFLKYLEALEQEGATEAQLRGQKYSPLLDMPYRWETWAAPKAAGNAKLPIGEANPKTNPNNANLPIGYANPKTNPNNANREIGAPKSSSIDHNRALSGDDLRDFVNLKLFPYLTGFKQRASGPNTIEYKIGEIFGEIKNKIQSGYNLREIIDHIDELRFGSQTEKQELSHLYEAKIRNMGNAGRNGGEYYTPRPLIRAIIQVIKPRIGERIYDGACGSAGFLCESFEYLKASGNANVAIGGAKLQPNDANREIGVPRLSTKDFKTLQERTFFGKEKNPSPTSSPS